MPVANFKTLGGLKFVGVGGNPRGLWKVDSNNVMRRLGIAFSLNEKTVLRMGIGVYYDTIGVDRQDVNQGGFNQATNFVPTLNNRQTYVATLSNPFPNGLQVPTGSSQGIRTFLGGDAKLLMERQPNHRT